MDYFQMFQNFAGRQPDVTPMLEARGLVPGNEAADSEVADDGPATVGDAGNAGTGTVQ